MDAGLLKDILIPITAILVPSLIAIFLARSERLAAKRDRDENDRREEDKRVNYGVEQALAGMDDLVQAAYSDDFREAARMRFAAARRISRIQTNLGEGNEVVWDWISEELGTVAQGLEDKTDLGLPVLMEQVVWRGAHFTNTMTDWLMQRIDLGWFQDAEHGALADTVAPTNDE